MDETQRQLLLNEDVKFIRFLWCDNANIIRAKAGHITHLEDFVDNGINIAVAQQAVPAMHDVVVPETGLGPVGEVRLMPDWSTLKKLPYAPQHALVISDMMEGKTRKVWEFCPRGFLRRQIERLAAKELSIKAAFENEFYLMRRNSSGEPVPVDETVFCATGSMNQNIEFINDLAAALLDQGLEVAVEEAVVADPAEALGQDVLQQ